MRRTTCFYVLVSSVLLLLQGLQSDVVVNIVRHIQTEITDDGRAQRQEINTESLQNLTHHRTKEWSKSHCSRDECDSMLKDARYTFTYSRLCSQNARHSYYSHRRLEQIHSSRRQGDMANKSRQNIRDTRRASDVTHRYTWERHDEKRYSRWTNLQRTQEIPRISIFQQNKNLFEIRRGRSSDRKNKNSNMYGTRNVSSLDDNIPMRRIIMNKEIDETRDMGSRNIEARKRGSVRGEKSTTSQNRLLSIDRLQFGRKSLDYFKNKREQHRAKSDLMRSNHNNDRHSSVSKERIRSYNTNEQIRRSTRRAINDDNVYSTRRLYIGNRCFSRQGTTRVRPRDNRKTRQSQDNRRRSRHTYEIRDTPYGRRMYQNRASLVDELIFRDNQRNTEIRGNERHLLSEPRFDNNIGITDTPEFKQPFESKDVYTTSRNMRRNQRQRDIRDPIRTNRRTDEVNKLQNNRRHHAMDTRHSKQRNDDRIVNRYESRNDKFRSNRDVQRQDEQHNKREEKHENRRKGSVERRNNQQNTNQFEQLSRRERSSFDNKRPNSVGIILGKKRMLESKTSKQRKRARGAESLDTRRVSGTETITLKRRDGFNAHKRNNQKSFRKLDKRAQSRRVSISSISSDMKTFALENVKIDVAAMSRTVLVCLVGYIGRQMWLPKSA